MRLLLLSNSTQYGRPMLEHAEVAVRDHLAGKEMEIGRFYERTGQWLAAQLRFQNVIEEYQTTSHTPEALYRLTETNLALGLPEEAQKSLGQQVPRHGRGMSRVFAEEGFRGVRRLPMQPFPAQRRGHVEK